MSKLRYYLASALPIAGGLIFIAIVCVWLPERIGKGFAEVDMSVYYRAAVDLIHHRKVYILPSSNYGPWLLPASYVYPPQCAVLMAPIGYLRFHTFQAVLLPVLMAGLVGYAYNLGRIMRPVGTSIERFRDTLGWFAVLANSPNQLKIIAYGNIDILLWYLVSLAFISSYRPLILAITLQVKPYTALPLLASWWRERYSLVSPLVSVAVGCAIGAAVCGVDSFVAWKQSVAVVIGQGTFSRSNVSLSFAVLRILQKIGIWHYTYGPLPTEPRVYLAVMSIAGPLATAYLLRRLPNLKYYAAILLSCVLFAPVCWLNYISVSYILIALYLRDRIVGSGKPLHSDTAEPVLANASSRAAR